MFPLADCSFTWSKNALTLMLPLAVFSENSSEDTSPTSTPPLAVFIFILRNVLSGRNTLIV